MASRTIYLRIGKRDRIPLSAFINSLSDFLGILRDLDATISKDQRGSVIWEVVSLRQNSPPEVGVSSSPRPDVQDFSETVESQVLENIGLLSTSVEPTPYMSYAALRRFEHLAALTKSIGPHTVYIDGSGAPKQEAGITEKTFENVQLLTGVRYLGYGSIIGSLDGIYVHNANEFRVWDENSGKPVKCKFAAEQEEKIKSLLRHRVIATGTVKSNRAGVPIALDVENVNEAAKGKLPTIEEMSGSIKGITEGKSLKQYLEEVEDE